MLASSRARSAATRLSRDQGIRHGRDTIAKFTIEGFPTGTVVFLDIENYSSPLSGGFEAYIRGWISAPPRDPILLPRHGERHLHEIGVHVCGFETSPYGIEWMRFDPQCRVPEIVKTVPHLAFAVDNLDAALEGKEILIAPNSPSYGVRVAFILDDGAPVELLEFDGPDRD